nr:hypothetical protein [uncultured Porphyromonas sp.]
MKTIYSPSFRSMSRRLALTLGLLLALLLSLPAYAQDGQSKVPINRTISGFTLGVTTPAEARAIIQRQGGKIIRTEGTQAGSDEQAYAVEGLKYARRSTFLVTLHFCKGHLRKIAFVFDKLDVLEQIESELENKYGMMAEGKETSKMKSKVVFDAFTRLLVVRGFKYEGHVGFKDAYITYSDDELDRARSAEKESEI